MEGTRRPFFRAIIESTGNGDEVVIDTYRVAQILHGGKSFLLIDESDVLGIIDYSDSQDQPIFIQPTST
jgi:hypothetical protein